MEVRATDAAVLRLWRCARRRQQPDGVTETTGAATIFCLAVEPAIDAVVSIALEQTPLC